MTTYLGPTDPEAYIDFPAEKTTVPADGKECPVCHGFGGWNLRLNAYPLHGRENTAANRHRYSHFRCSCSHCNGWGWVHKSETCPAHQWERTRTTGHCLTLWTCTVCGKQQQVDSSD